jgi:hypothetical protein
MVAALAAPAIGPLVDHHFADRQPWHSHVGPLVYHVHSYGQQHPHAQADPGEADGVGLASLYGYETPLPAGASRSQRSLRSRPS